MDVEEGHPKEGRADFKKGLNLKTHRRILTYGLKIYEEIE